VGSVVAAAVVLHPDRPIAGLADSKALTERRREQLYAQIIEQAAGFAVAEATVAEIDRLNILQATFLAMQRAVAALPVAPAQVWVDGNQRPRGITLPVQTFVKGDQLHACISAASILAKVTRDRQMQVLDQAFPQYGFARHKGYPTAAHLAALAAHGILEEHRRSYAPVKKYL
jgi:ribonuclease HII